MNHPSRRQFLRASAFTGVGAVSGMFAFPGLLHSASANEEVRLGVIGIRSQGNGHIGRFQKLKGVKVVALCDPDSKILAQRLEEVKKAQETSGTADVQGYADIRKMLERKDVDAVVIATPNHWHALAAIWACQAGKHVYVEKPVSHSIWEGRKIVEAARKYKRVVQAGTQQRSCLAVQEAARDVQGGKYGKVLWVHCSKLESRKTIDKVTSPQPVPEHIDYNLWAGPAPMTPVMRKQFHYDWHWQWPWGDGEMGNWGIHYIDDVRHILGWKDIPTKVIAAGGRFLWDDNGETPNMHFALFDYDGTKMVVDIRNLPDPGRDGDEEGAIYLKMRGGNYIQCENAVIRISRGGGTVYDKAGQKIHQYKGDGGGAHGQNFIDGIRNNSSSGLAAEIEVGHLSTAICHQANMAWRVGKEMGLDEVKASFRDSEDAVNTLADMVAQLQGNKLDVKRLVAGPMLTYDRKSEAFVGSNAAAANKLLRVPYRDSFVVPEKV